ncbi:hypothetical protein QQS21_011096 [Conoideocrella luteorostrata]|uniref:Zn(2)-C6 fungal-type domain-containing protein n=1 Tax=Conoideocrella luteorostrata TaxID=1105319 RepID=A0AAJ0CDY6_9HYPO|nr:hypothetical protein QQS21_011096 [Conoideocrella luteorostrata]
MFTCVFRPVYNPMAPSTANPSSLHRAPVACLKCRAAKVRCLVSQQPDRCDRCISTDIDCVFSLSKRARAKAHPYPRQGRRTFSAAQERVEEHAAPRSTLPSPSGLEYLASSIPPATPGGHDIPQAGHNRHAPITPDIRARIIATLASLKGKRGSQFSFITSADTPSFRATAGPDDPIQLAPPQQLPSEPAHVAPPSLKLSGLLRPLRDSPGSQAGDDGQAQPMVKMPSYLSSMTLCQTVIDPIESGMLTREASVALFSHFMLEMNTKWEYILDPYLDTHDDVRQRSPLLFATILFCSSKFTNFLSGSLVSTTDPFLQSRLCSLARSLAIKTFAEGNRSIESMQAFYLLVCWKDADDDVSYLHSGYAFRILHDLDLEQSDGNARQAARRMRTWMALFRQDKQQSLFFMRRASLSHEDGNPPCIGDLDTWLKMPHALPFDFIACCSADLRRIQSKLRGMVHKASLALLPCVLELMDSELNRWKSTWKNHLQGEGRLHYTDSPILDQRLLVAGKPHLQTLVGLWEHSVRLNLSSAILRQALMGLMTSSLRPTEQPYNSSPVFDISMIADVLSPDIPGLSGSVNGAFGTLRHLLEFSTEDLRRAPDSVLLLGPNAALYLCLLLCLPCNGLIGPSFQKGAINLMRDVARHIQQSIQSAQDTLTLHSKYLESLVDLLVPSTAQNSSNMHDTMRPSNFDSLHMNSDTQNLDETTLQAAQLLAGGIGALGGNVDNNDAVFNFISDPERNLHVQSLVNLLDTDFFWEIPPSASEIVG